MDEAAAVCWLSFFSTAEERSDLSSLFLPCPSPPPLFPSLHQHNTLCVRVFVFTKEPVCQFLVYVLCVFVLQGH